MTPGPEANLRRVGRRRQQRSHVGLVRLFWGFEDKPSDVLAPLGAGLEKFWYTTTERVLHFFWWRNYRRSSSCCHSLGTSATALRGLD